MTQPQPNNAPHGGRSRCRGRTLITHHPSLITAVHRRSAFTLIEMLVVIGIILILTGLFFGIQRSMQISAMRGSAGKLIAKVELAIIEYEAKFGTTWSNALPDVSGGSLSDAQVLAANALVTSIVLRHGDFTSTESTGQAVEIVTSGGTKYLVDPWYDLNEGAANTLRDHMIRFARNRFNEPELDIWSTGPDDEDDSCNLTSGSNSDEIDDDIVNWGQQ